VPPFFPYLVLVKFNNCYYHKKITKYRISEKRWALSFGAKEQIGPKCRSMAPDGSAHVLGKKYFLAEKIFGRKKFWPNLESTKNNICFLKFLIILGA